MSNRLSQIVVASRTYGFTHDLSGQRTGLTDPNGVTTTYSYTPAGYLNNILARNSQQVTIDSFAYTHDALGRRTTLTDLAGLHTYQYDDTYQLTQATHPVPPTEQFSYDPVGNRLGTMVDLNNALLEDSEFTYTYDYSDNLIQKVKKSNGEITTFTYDYENRLTRVQYPGMDAQYKYDALGRRIEKNVNGQVIIYVYDGLNMVTDYNGLWTVRSKYVFGLGLDEPLSIDQSSILHYYHGDGLGSVNELTDASGNVARTYRYDGFGKIIAQTGSLDQPFTFTGREYDPETGLYYYRARYYDPKAGRFISKDPIGFLGGDVNLFRYVGNDPGNWVDPFGLLNFSDAYSRIEGTFKPYLIGGALVVTGGISAIAGVVTFSTGIMSIPEIGPAAFLITSAGTLVIISGVGQFILGLDIYVDEFRRRLNLPVWFDVVPNFEFFNKPKKLNKSGDKQCQ